jgi:hypothetical protein
MEDTLDLKKGKLAEERAIFENGPSLPVAPENLPLKRVSK